MRRNLYHSLWALVGALLCVWALVALHPSAPACNPADPTPESYERDGYDGIEYDADSAEFGYRPCPKGR